ncbi:uncharacterized protein MYCGRDRAFT_106688 [Zymoseptoria tritici IPO323]|uniref:Uncharacterized protein n=1 Tax=Zymoseptoria tritici (strain CBS 115943 / IPO323) TaxID=336722 RepID=F9XRX4_ZYMTI|nr:uncharacterized protein MYCGRDRAFT_106688 [Zymoseptoria tritici IPO323]EGP82025.1 hypothetical protein MYCGRDRAFT_106688 [Zymoseptoria tritici IPO323]
MSRWRASTVQHGLAGQVHSHSTQSFVGNPWLRFEAKEAPQLLRRLETRATTATTRTPPRAGMRRRRIFVLFICGTLPFLQ